MAQSTHIVEVFKSRNIILSLLERQGYNITNYQGSSINEVHSMYQTKQMDMLVTNEENNKKAYIQFLSHILFEHHNQLNTFDAISECA